MRYSGDATPSSLKCSCLCGVKNDHDMVDWVRECCGELGTPIAIPLSDTKEFFCWDILEMLLRVSGEK